MYTVVWKSDDGTVIRTVYKANSRQQCWNFIVAEYTSSSHLRRTNATNLQVVDKLGQIVDCPYQLLSHLEARESYNV